MHSEANHDAFSLTEQAPEGVRGRMHLLVIHLLACISECTV